MVIEVEAGNSMIGIRSVIGHIKFGITTTIIVGLVTLNVTTLTNDRVHDLGFQALKYLATMTLGEVLQAHLFSSSPTVRKTLEIDKAIQRLQIERNALKGENLKLSKANQELAAKVIKRTQVASEVLPSMRARASRVAVRNATSIVGGAIPYIGIGITIGVTAADLHDMCEQDKEISALLVSNELVSTGDQAVCNLKLPTKQEIVDQLNSSWQVAYINAVKVTNQSGRYIDSINPPRVVWEDLKSTVCPILTYKLGVCD